MRQKAILDQQYHEEYQDIMKTWRERKAEAEKTLLAENNRVKALLQGAVLAERTVDPITDAATEQ